MHHNNYHTKQQGLLYLCDPRFTWTVLCLNRQEQSMVIIGFVLNNGIVLSLAWIELGSCRLLWASSLDQKKSSEVSLLQ
jgi:hypothetical protein